MLRFLDLIASVLSNLHHLLLILVTELDLVTIKLLFVAILGLGVLIKLLLTLLMLVFHVL